MKNKRTIFFAFIFIALASFIILFSFGIVIKTYRTDIVRIRNFGTWDSNGIPLSLRGSIPGFSVINSIPDGTGGVIVVWDDTRTDPLRDVYAQKIDSDGRKPWGRYGTPVCGLRQSDWYPDLTSDGEGGAIIVWETDRGVNTADIYAHRIDSSGSTTAWPTSGTPVCSAPNDQKKPAIASDGYGGAFIVWQDSRGGTDAHLYLDIYVQRLNEHGLPQFSTNGIPICSAPYYQRFPKIISDGAGGAFIVWIDGRRGSADLYAQRINGYGNPIWDTNGMPITTAADTQQSHQIIPDGNGGAIITWHDYRSGSPDIYAQRVDGGGNPLWQENGKPICTAPGEQTYPNLTSDGNNGAIITWQDCRSGSPDIYAQRVDGGGNPLWQENGKPISTAPGDQFLPVITSDSDGYSFIAWTDQRAGPHERYTLDIYAQSLSPNGNIQWRNNGEPICTEAGMQIYPDIAPDDRGDAVIIWQDWRYGMGSGNLYAQKVEGPHMIIVDETYRK